MNFKWVKRRKWRMRCRMWASQKWQNRVMTLLSENFLWKTCPRLSCHDWRQNVRWRWCPGTLIAVMKTHEGYTRVQQLSFVSLNNLTTNTDNLTDDRTTTFQVKIDVIDRVVERYWDSSIKHTDIQVKTIVTDGIETVPVAMETHNPNVSVRAQASGVLWKFTHNRQSDQDQSGITS